MERCLKEILYFENLCLCVHSNKIVYTWQNRNEAEFDKYIIIMVANREKQEY